MKPGTGARLAVLFAAVSAVSVVAHDLVTTRVTWDHDIAPLVGARCLQCHSEAGPAVSLASYADARPYARAIREEVLTRRMPKWPVVRGYGDFANDPSLSASEIALVTAWADGGAPENATRTSAGRASAGALAQTVAPSGPAMSRIPAPAVVRVEWRACGSGAVPAGRLVGIELDLPENGSLRATLSFVDGRREPLVWVRQFDPEFAEPFWLRTPRTLLGGTRLEIQAVTPSAGACRLALHYTT